MHKSRKPFLCLDCHIDTGKANEYYYLKQDIWGKIHNSIWGMLCIGCAEARLGRQLTKDDFTDATINKPKYPKMSMRFLSRVTT